MKTLRLVLMGPPGSGKGTQAKILAKREDLAHLSTGDILRAAIASGSELGLRAKEAVEAGRLVSDEVLYGVVSDALSKLGSERGLILDGFPRSEGQVEFLETILPKLGIEIDAVVLLDVPEETLTKRLSGRRVCPSCAKEYHVEFSPPKIKGKCDHCGGKLRQREDDKPKKIAERLKIYNDVNVRLVRHYEDKSLLIRVAAEGSIEDVSKRVIVEVESKVKQGRLRHSSSKHSNNSSCVG